MILLNLQTPQKLQVSITVNVNLNFYKINKYNFILGFGTFGKQQKGTPINAEELTTEDLESQRVQEIMGISEFGRKAKTFDITVRF